jgi:hypothetical protein
MNCRSRKQPARQLLALAWTILALIACDALARTPTQQQLALADSPYVLRTRGGSLQEWTIEETPSGGAKRVRDVKEGAEIDIPGVGDIPSFRVKLRSPAPADPFVVDVPVHTPLFVVADTHGEYEILVELLQKQRIVDSALRWSFRKGHLVFLGDVFDRGPNHTEILWLIYRLEAQAAKDGGGVHLVLGNHETIVLGGDLRYLNEKYLRSARALGVDSYSELFGSETVLGQWLRAKPAVLKLNDLLCLHGGISPAVVERRLTLEQLNASIRSALSNDASSDQDRERSAFAMGRLGPLWYRGYFPDQPDFPTATTDDVDRTLEHFDVKRILVGHTIVPTVTKLYDGRVIAVQVYPRRDEQTKRAVIEAVRIEGTRLLRATIDGRREPLN